MRINMLGSLTAHLHIALEVPLLGAEAALDLKLVDRDSDGDPEIEVRWNLPGTLFDSGSEGVVVEIPVSVLLGPPVSALLHALRTAGAPGLIVDAVEALSAK